MNICSNHEIKVLLGEDAGIRQCFYEVIVEALFNKRPDKWGVEGLLDQFVYVWNIVWLQELAKWCDSVYSYISNKIFIDVDGLLAGVHSIIFNCGKWDVLLKSLAYGMNFHFSELQFGITSDVFESVIIFQLLIL